MIYPNIVLPYYGISYDSGVKQAFDHSSTMSVVDIARAAKAAFEKSQLIPSSERIDALSEIKRQLESMKDAVLAANAEDLRVSSTPTDNASCLTDTSEGSTRGGRRWPHV